MSFFDMLAQKTANQLGNTAALTVLAFCFYSADKELCLRMFDYLRGPRPL